MQNRASTNLRVAACGRFRTFTNSPLKRLVTPQGVLTVLGLSGVVLLVLPFDDDEVLATVFSKWLPPPLPPFRRTFNVGLFFWFLTPFVLLPFAILNHGLDLMFRRNFLLHLDHHRLADIPYLKHQELKVIGRA